MRFASLRRRIRALDRRLREARVLARAFRYPWQPVVAQIIPTRRCNLSCTYCNEYDRVSDPVPLDEMRRRIDRLAELGTAIITLSGGEPLLHPGVADLIQHIRRRGAVATLITNGYLLSPALIGQLNDAGLDLPALRLRQIAVVLEVADDLRGRSLGDPDAHGDVA